MKQRLLLLVIGFLCLRQSALTFPTMEEFSLETLLNKLVFHSFQWLGAIFLFIGGFLALSRVIKTVTEEIVNKRQLYSELGWVLALFLVFVVLGFQSIWIALGGLGISLFYGIMDAKLHKRIHYYHH